MSTTLSKFPKVTIPTLPDDAQVRRRARQLYFRERQNRVTKQVDGDQTERSCVSRPTDDGAALHHTYCFDYGNRTRTDLLLNPAYRGLDTHAWSIWRIAKIAAEFEAWERLGLARIVSDYDGGTDRSWYEDDCKPIRDHFDAMSSFYTRADYRFAAEDESGDDVDWEWGDSCGGHLGYDDVEDPFENEIVADHMATVNEILRAYFDPATHFGEGI